MNTITPRNQRWIFLPLLFCSAAVLSSQASAAEQVKPSTQAALDMAGQDDFREVNNTNFGYVGGQTRIGIGIDTEFDGTADISHTFSESADAATSGDGWIGFDVSGDDKGVSAGGVRLNHNWVGRDEQGRPLRVNKVFGAYDRNADKHDKVTVGYGQEIDTGFWEAYVGTGLSDKRRVGLTPRGRELFEKTYKHNVGGQVGKFLPDSNIRVRGGLDYAWDTETGVGEDRAEQVTVSAGVEKFFQGTPHSVALDVEASRKDGGHGEGNTDTRANLSYRYEFGADGVYQTGEKYRRVRVEVPGQATAPTVVRKEIKTPYKRAVQVGSCKLQKSTVELGSDTFFKVNSSKLLPSAKTRLNNVISQIRRSGYEGNIRITGNTCDIGKAKHNQKLSERRAKAVKSFMAAKGFDKAELVARGLGEEHPKYANTKATRHKNRRVDIEYVTREGSCGGGSKTVYKTAYKTEYKDVVVNQGGIAKPSVTWRTEAIPSEPLWVKRALHNNIRHSRRVDTYRTTAGSTLGVGFNNPIRVVNDDVTTTTATPITIDVLSNDTGEVLQVTEVGQAANGTASIVNGAVVYTPAAGFVGIDQFTYTVRDRNGSQSQGTVTVTVESVAPANNVAPVAQDDEIATNVNQPISINVLANDTDADSDTLAITSIQQPAHGTAAIVDGQIRYTPAQGFSGTDTIRYTITDGNGHIVSATARVVVVGNTGNGLIAQDDSVATSAGVPITINVIGNDRGAEGATLSISGITQPSNGTAAVVNGQVVYTPAQGFSGTDTLTYTITDGNNHTQTASIRIVVTGRTNVAPQLRDDQVSTPINQPITINAVGNDSDLDGDTLRVTAITQPSNGTAAIVGGQVVYTPAQDFLGTDTLTYTVTDGHNHTATATMVITVNGRAQVNVAPVAQNDTVTISGAGSTTVNVLGNDNDPDGDTLIITSITQPRNGRASVVDGQIVYTPNQGFTGNDTLSYTITDGNNHIQTATLALNVTDNTGPNVRPTVQDDVVTTSANQSVTINAIGNDSDADGDTLSIIRVTQPSNGATTVRNGQVVYTPARDFSGTDRFTYTVTDGNNHTQTANVSVRVIGGATVNVVPTVQDDVAITSTNQPVSINVTGNDSDGDGDMLTIVRVTQPSNGRATVRNGQVVYTPTRGFTGTDTLTYTVTDDHGHTGNATVTVTVRGDGAGNVAPIARDDTATTAANQSITINTMSNDSDADRDLLSIVRVTQPTNGRATVRNGQVVYTPTRGFTGIDRLTYTVSDSNGHAVTADVSITVSGNNGAGNAQPVVRNDSATTTTNQSVTINAMNNDSDPDNDTLRITRVTQPSNGTASVRGGQIVYTPAQGFTGTDTLTYTVDDGNSHTQTANIRVVVSGNRSGSNSVPVAGNDSGSSRGNAVAIDVMANDSDADGDTMAITRIGNPHHGTASVVQGSVLYTPEDGFTGTDSFIYEITDGHDHASTATVTVNVMPSTSGNRAPDVNDDYLGTMPANELLVIRPLNNDSDPDGDSLTLVSVGSSNYGRITDNGDGTINFVPERNYCGPIEISYTVSDGHGHTSTATIHTMMN